MHAFTWDSKNQEEILDCDLLYKEEEEDEESQQRDPEDLSGLPPFLRQQKEREKAEQEGPVEQVTTLLDDELAIG
jgi:hypothetical protein